MLSLYEILKASKTGIAPDMWTALAGMNWGGKDSGAEVKELTGVPPLSFNADGTPLLDYLISGNMSQSGTPSPTTPIQPSECGERTGNLWNYTIEQGGWIAAAGTIPTKLTPSDTNYPIRCRVDSIVPIPSRIMSLTCSDGIKIHFVWIDSNGYSLGGSGWQRNGSTVTAPINATALTFILAKVDDTNCTPSDFKNIMLSEGSTPLPYEPYGYIIPILSANITTNVYLGEVPTTRKIKKLMLTGNESYTKNDADPTQYLYYGGRGVLLPNSIERTPLMCNELPVTSGAPQSQVGISSNNNYSVVYLNFGGDIMNSQPSGNTVAGLKEYLAAQYAAGTPVTVWYVLATETTGIVNVPLRKIGNYADTLSMEQAGVDIPTNNGNTVIDVETTLKPSEMYIKYQG